VIIFNLYKLDALPVSQQCQSTEGIFGHDTAERQLPLHSLNSQFTGQPG